MAKSHKNMTGKELLQKAMEQFNKPINKALSAMPVTFNYSIKSNYDNIKTKKDANTKTKKSS